MKSLFHAESLGDIPAIQLTPRDLAGLCFGLEWLIREGSMPFYMFPSYREDLCLLRSDEHHEDVMHPESGEKPLDHLSQYPTWCPLDPEAMLVPPSEWVLLVLADRFSMLVVGSRQPEESLLQVRLTFDSTRIGRIIEREFSSDPRYALMRERHSSQTDPQISTRLLLKVLEVQHRQIEAIEASESRMFRLAEQSLDLIYRIQLKPKFQILYISPIVERWMGCTREELYKDANTAFKHIDPRDTTVLQHMMNEENANQGVTLVRFLPSEGDPYWIEHRWFVDRSTNRSVIVLDGVGRDVTLQKRQEEAIQESLRTAEENLRAKSLFLANMSHEIRTPLNAIIGQVELLRDTSLSSEQREMLDSISSAGSILLSHLTDVLDFSRLEAQRVKLHKGAFDLVKALREALDIVKDTARERNLALESSFDRAVPVQVIGDKSRLLQIVLNLLSNAIKFTDHGEVRLTLSVLEECESSVRVEVAVSDTGIGFPVETWNEMLQPFSQRDPSYSRKREGAGLGLAIVSRLVDLMDADLRVESEPGVGSTFFLRLDFPIPTGTSRYCDKSEENPDAADSEENESALTLGVGGRVLIVEDNEVNRKVLVRQLQKIGFSETDCAHNGEEAIRIFQPEFHQLVLMDIQMPMLDGVEALNALRKAHPTHNVPIVAVTAHALPGDRENYLELGFQGYISKPVRLPELRSTLRIALARNRT